MNKAKKNQNRIEVANRTDPYFALGTARVESDRFWRWGDDNLFPAALALMARRSTTHRRIINDKADYISGKGFTCDEAGNRGWRRSVRRVNGSGESLRQVLNKLAFDKSLFGNAFSKSSPTRASFTLALPSGRLMPRARLGTHPAPPRLGGVQTREARSLPPYPQFERQEDGSMRSIVHYKGLQNRCSNTTAYRPISRVCASRAIAWKTDRWNISRLDNPFQAVGRDDVSTRRWTTRPKPNASYASQSRNSPGIPGR